MSPTPALPLVVALALTACSSKDNSQREQSSGSPPVVVIETSMGSIKVELDPKRAPLTVENFLDYVDAKHYDGTIFHRVMPDFMIQGGGFAPGEPPTQKQTREPIKNEAKTSGLSNTIGTIAMARTDEPDTATAQFFINVVDNGQGKLDPGGFSPDGYAAFGRVIGGMEVADKIRTVKTGTRALASLRPDGGHVTSPAANVPLSDVIITSIRRVGN